MPINRVGAAGIGSCTVAAQDIEDATLTNANFGPGSISNAQLANSSITVNGTSASLGGTLTLKEEINWQAVQVADGSTQVVATAGNGYFIDTNAGVTEVFLPSSPTRGDVVAIVDYAGTFATNQCIVNTGGVNIDSTVGSEFKLTTNETIAYFVYVDSNKGWMVYLNQAASTTPSGISTGGGYYDGGFISATGGTITTSGDYKVHVFTGDGCFVVSSGGGPLAVVDYLVVAGGGGGGTDVGGGGGAGGFRTSNYYNLPAPTTSPLANCTGISLAATTYPITVGGGGTASIVPGYTAAGSGSDSIFSTITSTGGGAGGATGSNPAQTGGSGGGGGGGIPTASGTYPGASGNTPPVSPPQGNNGGSGVPNCSGLASGGGGGASAVGVNALTSPNRSGAGGAGSYVSTSFAVSCTGTSGPVCGTRYFGGGGGGGSYSPPPYSGTYGAGGDGGGGPGGNPATPGNPGVAGTTNTGGGGGGGPGAGGAPGGAGGKGIVLIRYKFQ